MADSHKSTTRSRPVSRHPLAQLRDLYDATVLQIVSWSEGEVLRPQYLHLHELDIGIEEGYELGNYLVAFVASLAKLQKRIRRIVFCYSYEATEPKSPVRNPDACTRELFYSFELHFPGDRGVVKSDITWAGGDVTTKPLELSEHIPIERLHEILRGCHLVQPYMLREGEDGVDAQYELADATDQKLRTLTDWFRWHGGYQFSVYGFEVAGERLSDAERLLLNFAFLVHIWTWNHDLRTIHQIRQVALHNLPRSRELWARLSAEFDGLFTRLQDLHVSGAGHSDNLIHLERKQLDELFDEPHDLSTWEPSSFPRFLETAYRRIGGRRLNQFLEYCGWPDASCDVPSEPSEITAARGCWLATKYLTRCALDTMDNKYRRLSFDQVLLAVLFGLHDSRAQGVRLAVFRSLEYAADDAALQTENDCIAALGLSFAEPQLNWMTRSYEVHTGAEADAKRVTAFWKYDGTEGAYLPGFLRSGMLAMQVISPTLHVFDSPMYLGETDGLAVSSFLVVIARLSRALGRQVLEHHPMVKPTEVKAVLRTRRNREGRKTHRASISFQLDGVLLAHITPGGGQLSGPLTSLASWCGASTPTRVDGPVDSDDWNCFVVARPGGSELLLTFKEGRT